MNTFKLMAALTIGALSSNAMAQMTNTMGNSMGAMGSGPMSNKPMDKGMAGEHKAMPMHHKMGHSRMMHHPRHHGMMKHHKKMMKHGM